MMNEFGGLTCPICLETEPGFWDSRASDHEPYRENRMTCAHTHMTSKKNVFRE